MGPGKPEPRVTEQVEDIVPALPLELLRAVLEDYDLGLQQFRASHEHLVFVPLNVHLDEVWLSVLKDGLGPERDDVIVTALVFGEC